MRQESRPFIARRPGRWSARAIVAVSAISIGTVCLSTTGAAAVAGGPPSTTAAANTPHLALTNNAKGVGQIQQVRQIAQCGSTMYAVGTFTTIKQGSQTYTRDGAFSFSAKSPYKMTSWNPTVNGTVDTIGFNGTDCTNAYLGGTFTTVGGTSAKDIAEVNASTGALVTTFKNTAGGQVDTIVATGGHLLVGGYFTGIGGTSADPYFASLNPTTGVDDGYAHLAISGNYVYTDTSYSPAKQELSNPTRVYNSQLSPDGTRLLVEGDFTSIGGQPRRQVAMLDLGPTGVTTDPWYASEFDANCSYAEPFYAQAAAWSPDGQTVYVANTGYKPATGPGSSAGDARAGLCDSAVAFPTTPGVVTHSWINYTGCDSMYAAGADASTAYFAGHERYADNPNPGGCDSKTTPAGAVSAPGFVGLAPSDGSVTYNPTRARGDGADDILVTTAGVWVASDNYEESDTCGTPTSYGHSGICFLPY